MLPILNESMTSLRQNYEVTLFLVSDYKVSDQRRRQLQDALPSDIRIEVWDDASPLGYHRPDRDSEKGDENPERLEILKQELARQHRYIIKDRFFEYDFFACFEDDMLVKAEHVSNFIEVSRQLRKLYDRAPTYFPTRTTPEEQMLTFSGTMVKSQVARLIPGFIRVEAVLPGWESRAELNFSMIPASYEWNGRTESIRPLCCQISETNRRNCSHLPDHDPSIEELYHWETSIDALGVRKLPEFSSLGWVLLQAGSTNMKFRNHASHIVGDYWSGNDYKFQKKERPKTTRGRYGNNQGGWMASRQQIVDWHLKHCPSGFLPPYERPKFHHDGLTKSVEFWSGGYHLFGINACNLQRVIPLDPHTFGKHLLYHTSNNKQRQDNIRYRFSFNSIDYFWAQLNTVKNNADKVLAKSHRDLPDS